MRYRDASSAQALDCCKHAVVAVVLNHTLGTRCGAWNAAAAGPSASARGSARFAEAREAANGRASGLGDALPGGKAGTKGMVPDGIDGCSGTLCSSQESGGGGGGGKQQNNEAQRNAWTTRHGAAAA